MRNLLRIVGIILINVLLVFLLLEAGLRLTARQLPGQARVAAMWVTTGQPFAEDWNPAWQQNREHYWSLRPGVEDALQYGSPTVAFRMSTIELWEGGGIGFRTDPVDFFVDAVVVGDSFGMCFTERVDCWVDQFAAQTDLGVVNLSQPVTGSTSHYRILRDFGAPLEPPLVIWQFFGNDFFDDYSLAVFNEDVAPPPEPEASADAPTLMDRLRRNSATVAVLETLLTGRFVGVPDSEALYVKPHRATYGANDQHILQFGGAYELQALDMSTEANAIGLDYSREAFVQAQELVASWGGEMVVVLIPTREEVYDFVTEPIMGADQIAQLASAREAMLTLCEELGLTCYDATDALRQQAIAADAALYYQDDMHLNPSGNQVLADVLADFLDDQNLLPPPTDS